MKFVSWNVNSIRQRTRPDGDSLGRLLREARPDVVCLQELQCSAHQVPVDAFRRAGYRALYCAEKGKNGVAILTPASRPAPTPVVAAPWPPAGAPDWLDREARFVAATVDGVVVASVYAPYGRTPDDPQWQHKLQFFAALGSWSRSVIRGGQCLLLAGDFNVAPRDLDWHLPEGGGPGTGRPRSPASWPTAWAAWCHPAMREALGALLAVGLVDLGVVPGQARPPTLFDERNFGRATPAGVRVDLFVGSLAVEARLQSTATLGETRDWPRPSDHVPIAACLRQVHRIFACTAGSRLHGTATANSDLDIDGIVLPPASDLLLGKGDLREAVQRKKPVGEKNVADDVDVHLRSPRDFVEGLASGQPTAWELLFAPAATLTADTTEQGRRFLAALRAEVPALVSGDVAVVLAACKQHLRRIVRELELRGLPLAQAGSLPADTVTPADAKKLAHALRIVQQHTELLQTGHITLPRANAAELRAIRAGERPLAEVLEAIERAKAELGRASEQPTLKRRAHVGGALAAVEQLYREHVGLPPSRPRALASAASHGAVAFDSRALDALDLSVRRPLAGLPRRRPTGASPMATVAAGAPP